MKLVLLHEAEIEFWESVEYYEHKSPGLGIRFKEEVDLFLAKIEADPVQPRLRQGGYRRVNLAVFKHYIAYIVRGEVLLVVAICHGNQRPGFWRDRLV